MIAEKSCWEELLRKAAEKSCWEELLRRAAEKSCWENLLRRAAEKICWEELLRRAAEKICWEELLRVFIGTICGIIPRFLLGGLLQALMKQNHKYFYLRNIGYFRDICHKLFLNNARFAADVVGFMIHSLGLRIFPKSFGFFLGCSQQDLLDIICGGSLLRKATEICSRISLKNCLWIFPIIKYYC